jgi:hypothetical protein
VIECQAGPFGAMDWTYPCPLESIWLALTVRGSRKGHKKESQVNNLSEFQTRVGRCNGCRDPLDEVSV